MGDEAGNSVVRRPMDPLRKERPSLLMEPLHRRSPDAFLRLKSRALQCFFEAEEQDGTCERGSFEQPSVS
jgi:hypothetical protein